MPRNKACQDCSLCQNINNVCIWGNGLGTSGIMIIVEAPGGYEDKVGEPLLGRTGQLVDHCLEAAGLKRHEIYSTHIVKCRPHDSYCQACNKQVAIACGLPYCDLYPANFNRNPKPTELKACRKYLDEELITVKPKVIVLMGSIALQAFTGNTSITKARGKLLDCKKSLPIGDAKVIATLHPAYALRQGTKAEQQIINDLQTAARLVGRGPASTLPTHNLHLLLPGYTIQQFQDKLRLLEPAKNVCLDLEWVAPPTDRITWPWSKNSDLLSCSLSGFTKADKSEITSVSFVWPKDDFVIVTLLKDFQSRHGIGGHNLIADFIYLRDKGFRATPVYDTMAEIYHIDEDQPRSLEVATTIKAKIDPSYKHKNSLLPVRPADDEVDKWENLLTRGANDTYGTVIVHEKNKEDINNLPNLQPLYPPIYPWEKQAVTMNRRAQLLTLYSKVTLPRIKIAAEMSWRGAPVDISEMDKALNENEKKLVGTISSIKATFDDLLAPATALRLKGDLSAEALATINKVIEFDDARFQTFLNTPKALKEMLNYYLAMNNSDLRLLGTSKEELSMFQDEFPIAAQVREYRHIRNKILGTYLRPWRSLISEQPSTKGNLGWLHAVYSLYTSTGRASASSELGGSLHQMPREPWMRRIIRAPKGCKLVSADLSQIELRMAAWLANLERMLELYRNDTDIHLATAAYVSIALPKYGMSMKEFWPRMDEFTPLVTDEQRARAKPVSFGFMYGQQPAGFVEYARAQFGINFTPSEAFMAYQGFHNMYPELAHYFQQASRWFDQGWCTSPFQVVRHHAISPTDYINHPIQSAAATLLALSSIMINKEIEEQKLRCIPVAEIHDSIITVTHVDEISQASAIIKKHMERPPTEWLGVDFKSIPVAIKADVSVEDYWGQSKEKI